MKHLYLVLPAIAFIVSTMIIRMQIRTARIRGDELGRSEVWQIVFAVFLAAVATAFAFLVLKDHLPA